MSDVLKYLEKIKQNQLKLHEKNIEYVLNNEVPQHILATKQVADALTVGEEGYSSTEVGFFFKERLVNRLMHLCYLKGASEIETKSFEAGYNKAIELMEKKLKEV